MILDKRGIEGSEKIFSLETQEGGEGGADDFLGEVVVRGGSRKQRCVEVGGGSCVAGGGDA